MPDQEQELNFSCRRQRAKEKCSRKGEGRCQVGSVTQGAEEGMGWGDGMETGAAARSRREGDRRAAGAAEKVGMGQNAGTPKTSGH